MNIVLAIVIICIVVNFLLSSYLISNIEIKKQEELQRDYDSFDAIDFNIDKPNS